MNSDVERLGQVDLSDATGTEITVARIRPVHKRNASNLKILDVGTDARVKGTIFVEVANANPGD